VSHSGGRPILFLPDRDQVPGIPEGWTDITVDGEPYEANIVKVAINVVRRPGTEQNELPTILRRWFGPNAGLPGTDFKVTIEQCDTGYRMLPFGRTEDRSKPELWRSYSREEIPGLFGLKFNRSVWQTGFVVQPEHIFLLVTLEKGDMQEQFRYQDRFLGADLFQWQSQNQTRQTDKRGQALRHHAERGIQVHLFARRTGKTDSRATPFIYCGEVDFEDWEGEKPITVRWRMRDPLPERLQELLTVPGKRRT